MKVRRIKYPDGRLSDDWYVDYCVLGRRRRIRVGPDRKKAELVLAEIRTRIAREELGDLLPEARKLRSKTFSEFLEEYESRTKASYRESTRDRNRSRFGLLRSFFGTYRLRDIDTALVERFRQERAAKGKTPATINRDFALLRRMLNAAADWGDLPRRVDLRIRAYRVPPHDFALPTVEQLDKLVGECRGNVRDLVVLAWPAPRELVHVM